VVQDDGGEFHSPFPLEWFMGVYPYLAPEDKPLYEVKKKKILCKS
jgi:hypothetical protein